MVTHEWSINQSMRTQRWSITKKAAEEGIKIASGQNEMNLTYLHIPTLLLSNSIIERSKYTKVHTFSSFCPPFPSQKRHNAGVLCTIHTHHGLRPASSLPLPLAHHQSIQSHPHHIKDWPNHPQHQPTPPNNSPASPPHPQYQYRIYIYTRLHSPWADPSSPSIHLLLSASSRRGLWFRGRECAASGAPGRWRDSAGWSYVCSRSRGSSGCPLGKEGRRPRGSGWVRLPTSNC